MYSMGAILFSLLHGNFGRMKRRGAAIVAAMKAYRIWMGHRCGSSVKLKGARMRQWSARPGHTMGEKLGCRIMAFCIPRAILENNNIINKNHPWLCYSQITNAKLSSMSDLLHCHKRACAMLTVRNKLFMGMKKIVIRNVRETEIAGPLTISHWRNTFLQHEIRDERGWGKVMNYAIECPS